jgi:hypothetical protein
VAVDAGENNKFGVVFGGAQEPLVVRALSEGGEAARVGVRVGASAVELNGVPCSLLSREQFKAALGEPKRCLVLRQPAGAPIVTDKRVLDSALLALSALGSESMANVVAAGVLPRAVSLAWQHWPAAAALFREIAGSGIAQARASVDAGVLELAVARIAAPGAADVLACYTLSPQLIEMALEAGAITSLVEQACWGADMASSYAIASACVNGSPAQVVSLAESNVVEALAGTLRRSSNSASAAIKALEGLSALLDKGDVHEGLSEFDRFFAEARVPERLEELREEQRRAPPAPPKAATAGGADDVDGPPALVDEDDAAMDASATACAVAARAFLARYYPGRAAAAAEPAEPLY